MAAADVDDVKLEEGQLPPRAPPLQHAVSAPGGERRLLNAHAKARYGGGDESKGEGDGDGFPAPPGLQPRSVSTPGRLIKGMSQASRRRLRESQPRRPFMAVLAAARLRAVLGTREEMECPLCLSNVDVEEVYEVAACGHKMCRSCLVEYITLEVSDAHVTNLHCPCDTDSGQCATVLHTPDIKELVDADTFQRYTRFLATQKDPTLRACPKCSKLNSGSASRPKIVCSCGQEYCYFHSNAHVGQTCSAYRRLRASDLAKNDSFINKHAVMCPSPMCGLPVVKSSGCNHMTCSRCRSEFCYLCGAPVLFGGGIHFMKLNLLGCPGMQFSGSNANDRRRPWLWRMFGLPLCAVIALALASPLLGLAFAAWGIVLGGGFLCWVVLILKRCNHNDDLCGDHCLFMCGGPLALGMSLAVCTEPWLVPLSQLGKLLTIMCCCCCRRQRA